MSAPNILPANEHDAAPVSDRLVLAAINALRSYEYGNAAPDLAKAIADQLSAARAGTGERVLTYPAEFTEDLQWILGLICFQCIQYAQTLRKAGREIPTKAEAEQAATLDWMLRHYLLDPKDWRATAVAEMRAMDAAASVGDQA